MEKITLVYSPTHGWLPKYVRFGSKNKEEGGGTCLRFVDGCYYRDAGIWEVGVRKEGTNLFSVNVYGGDMDFLGNQPMYPIDKITWEQDNEPHIYNDVPEYNGLPFLCF